MTTRGIRNNNHLNIRYTGDRWLGLDEPPNDGAFCRFVNPIYGYRAAAIIIRKYIARGINTPAKIIATWAPRIENDTDAYITFVTRRADMRPDTVLHEPNANLLHAMALFESGPDNLPDNIYETIHTGIDMAFGQYVRRKEY